MGKQEQFNGGNTRLIPDFTKTRSLEQRKKVLRQESRLNSGMVALAFIFFCSEAKEKDLIISSAVTAVPHVMPIRKSDAWN